MPHERSRGQAEQLEEERRLMFVGITRAQQQLQISLAQYRDFRGERKPVIPSSFLMELPRGEMAVQQPETTRVVEIEELPPDHEPVFRPDDPREAAPARFGPGLPGGARGAGTVYPSPACGSRAGLRVAAEMLADGPREGVDPDVFRQGMVVLHPEYGLGKVVALGGSGGERTATIDFASAAGRKKMTLAGSELRPVK